MRSRIFRTILLAAACFSTVSAAQAGAGQPVGVMDRPRPEYDAKGLPLGAFRLRPALDVGASYDDNVYKTSTAKESDVFFTINPSFDLKSDWSRHLIEITGSLTRTRYLKKHSENRTDWFLGGLGRLDISRATTFEAQSSYQVLHEPRYSPDQPGGAASPTRYRVLHASGKLDYKPSRLGIELAGGYSRYDYDPTKLMGGGSFDNTDRNRDQYRASAKVSYEFSPGYALFLRGSYDERRYDTAAGQARNSHGYRGDAGAQMFLTHLVQGEIFVGFSRQNFRAPYKSADAIDYGAKLNWYMTPLMTVHLTAARIFNDTTIAGASVTDDQSVGLSLDYELLRDLILRAHADYIGSRFVGTTRDDRLFEAGFNAKYLINRYMSADAGYAFQRRSSTAAGQGFTDNLVQAGLHLQL